MKLGYPADIPASLLALGRVFNLKFITQNFF